MTRRVLVTRASPQAGSLEAALRRHALEPVLVPTIEVEIDPPGGRLDAAATTLDRFTWVVVTSPNGARAILEAVERVTARFQGPRWAAIGDVTAAVLEREGIEIAFRPSRPVGRRLAAELPLRPGQAVLLLRGNLAAGDLPQLLRDRRAEVTDVVAYRTSEGPASSRGMLRDAFVPGPPAAALFASGSAARGLLALAEAEHIDVRSLPAICIGPETAREAARLGFEVLAASPEPDAAWLAATTAEALAQRVESR